MYIVIGLNEDEYGRGESRPIKKLDDEEALRAYLLSCNEDISRLEIYRATKMNATLKIEEEESNGRYYR